MNIHQAQDQDAQAACRLVATSMEDFGVHMLGLGNESRELRALEGFFHRSGSRFSHEAIWLAELDGKIAGALLAFPGSEYDRRTAVTGKQLLGVYSLTESLRLVWRSLPALAGKETDSDQFYIAHLATHPDFRRRGVGQALMLHAETLARQSGLRACSLIVDYGNEPARNLYINLGYQVKHSIPTPRLVPFTSGYERLVKQLD